MVLINISRNRNEDIENEHVDADAGWRDGEAGRSRQSRTDINTLPCVKQVVSGKPLHCPESSAWCSVTTSGAGWLPGGEETQEGGGNCMLTLEPLHCTAESNTTLCSHYVPINKHAHSM